MGKVNTNPKNFSSVVVSQLITEQPLPYVDGRDFTYISTAYPCFKNVPPGKGKGIDSEEAGLVTTSIGKELGACNAYAGTPILMEHTNGMPLGKSSLFGLMKRRARTGPYSIEDM